MHSELVFRQPLPVAFNSGYHQLFFCRGLNYTLFLSTNFFHYPSSLFLLGPPKHPLLSHELFWEVLLVSLHQPFHTRSQAHRGEFQLAKVDSMGGCGGQNSSGLGQGRGSQTDG